jgi:hypothetical protein
MEERTKGKDAAEALTDFVNGAGSIDKQQFVQRMMTSHRTLQQESFDLFIMCMAEWAKVEENRYDVRNQYAVNKSKEIFEKVSL